MVHGPNCFVPLFLSYECVVLVDFKVSVERSGKIIVDMFEAVLLELFAYIIVLYVRIIGVDFVLVVLLPLL